ncbi:MAG: bifunctional 4-hydroxy-2-oxoglutarate aldolase/2-dehydro-3-deoxy-phosphogluconate aldolase [Acidobacteriota bacterium]
MTTRIDEVFGECRIVTLLQVESTDEAVSAAKVLVEAGLPVLEVVLRTRGAQAAIAAIAREVEGAIVGAGTITESTQIRASMKSGARFAVSPGLVPSLVKVSQQAGLPFLPGVMTPSEAMAARDLGFRRVKLFPAEAAGGVALLGALAGPLPELAFCPTGGIDETRFADYAGLPNVFAIGTSWIAPPELIAEGHWAEIVRRASVARRAFEA